MRVVFYKSKIERLDLIATANDNAESVIHDDFLDEQNKPTDGTSGKLTFDIIVDGPTTKHLRKKELMNKLKDDSITFDELKELLRSQL